MARLTESDRRLQNFWERAAAMVEQRTSSQADVTAAMLAAACKRLSGELGDDGAAECLAKLAVAYRTRQIRSGSRCDQVVGTSGDGLRERSAAAA